jgi:hypothetical protein
MSSLSWDFTGEHLSVASGGALPGSPDAIALPTGKSMGTGGGKLVGVRLLRERDVICFGFIGAANAKICVNESCSIDSHSHQKYCFEDGADALVFIETGAGQSVWASPAVRPDSFGGGWSRYATEKRSITSWQILMEALSNDPTMPEAELEKIGEATRLDKATFTPFKRRKLEGIMASPSESEGSFMDVTFVPLDTEAAPNLDLGIQSVLSQWKAVGFNLDLLHNMASSAKRGNRELEDFIGGSITELEAKLGAVRAILGSRPVELGTQTLFHILADQGRTMVDLDGALSLLVGKLRVLETNGFLNDQVLTQKIKDSLPDSDRDEAFKSAFKADLYTDLNAAMLPLRSFFKKFSSDVPCPGDLLENRLKALEARLPFNAGVPSGSAATGAPAGPSLAWGGFAQPAATSAATPLAPTQGSQAHDIALLTRRVKVLERSLDSQSVKLGFETFNSREDAAAWMKLNCPLAGSHAFFLDFHSLLALAFGPGSNTREVLKTEESRTKLNYSTSEEAIMTASFQIEIPAFYGTASSQATTLSAKVLPGLPTFAAWDTGDGDRGLRYDLRRKVLNHTNSWQTSASMALPPPAQVIAQTMLLASSNFVDFVSNWITQFYGDCRTKGANGEETWKHISHTIRELCQILHNARNAGQGPFLSDSDRASGIFWGSLQAYREMAVITSRGMMGDPRLSHILNLHLRDNAVMRSEMKEALTKIKNLQGEVTGLLQTRTRAAAGGRGSGAGRGAGGPGE